MKPLDYPRPRWLDAWLDYPHGGLSEDQAREITRYAVTMEERFGNHTKAVGDFLNELWAIMVDPLADGTRTVAETMEGLKKAALRERQAEHGKNFPPGWFLDQEP
jgi:plasmid stability protein